MQTTRKVRAAKLMTPVHDRSSTFENSTANMDGARAEARNQTSNAYAWQENGKAPKLRASCDQCAAAKVRCDQNRPSCHRCLHFNSPCNYSASRRMGKPPVSKQNQNNQPHAVLTAKTRNEGEANGLNGNSENSDGQRNNAQQLPDTTFGSYEHDFDNAVSKSWNDVNFMTDLVGSPEFAGVSDLQMNAMHFARLQSAVNQMPSAVPNLEPVNTAASYQGDADPNSDCFHSGLGQVDIQRRFSGHRASSDTVSPQVSSGITNRNTSCVEVASSTIQRLSLPSNMCNSSPDPTPLRTVEEILSHTRSAISAFKIILQCSCAQSSSSALSLALILSKILDCCSAICRSSSAASNGNSKQTSSSRQLPMPPAQSGSLTPLSSMGSSSSTTSTPGGPHNIVLDTPIAIGGYQVDPDDQYTFVLQLVMNEIRKVGKLVDAFVVYYSTTNLNNRNLMPAISNSANGRTNSGSDDVFESLEYLLRRQVHQASSEVDAVLRVGEEKT